MKINFFGNALRKGKDTKIKDSTLNSLVKLR
jgi:hypothetical protein